MIRATKISCLIIFVVGLWISLNIKVSEEVDQQLRYGFELFYTFSESGSFESASTSDTMDFYSIYPTSIKTWLIGDAHYNMGEERFYKGTDIGYMRMIFYFGVVGMAFMIMFNYLMYKMMKKVVCQKSLPLLFLMLYFVLNFKGEVLHLAAFYGIFLFIPSCERNNAYLFGIEKK